MTDVNVIEGKAKQVEGKAQDIRGDITGSIEDDLVGKAKQVEGKVQEEMGKARESTRLALERDNI